jgi:acyl-CoA synthetase (AMP-forming)/AMP-acid ligase II
MRDILASHNPASLAIVDADLGVEIPYGQLVERVAQAGNFLRRNVDRGLVFHAATNTVESVVLYLACLDTGCPVCLFDLGMAHRLEPILRAYDPDAILLPQDATMSADLTASEPTPEASYLISSWRVDRPAPLLHPDLALLLMTSGSTGNPKLVRLTRGNLLANAESIVSYLGIEPGERSMQSLPMQYSYGLSLVNSHLLAGGTVVLTRHSFLRPEFWKAFDQSGCTSLAGVPYMYETLHRLRFDPKRHPSLRTMTQAGGGLRRDLIASFHAGARAARCRFFVMYGQTEATARISYVPSERLGEKIGSIGVPIPSGRLTLAAVEKSELRELVYNGPNVMMGYAESGEDLAHGDELGGTLRTGDLGMVDDDGFFWLTGRLNRFAKLFGRRISLEDVEKEIESRYPVRVAAVNCGGKLVVYAAAREKVDLDVIGRQLARQLNVPLQAISVEAIQTIPLTASGKKDYRALPL